MGNASERRKRATLHNAEREAAKQGAYAEERMNLANPVMGMGKRLMDDVAFAWMAHLFRMREQGHEHRLTPSEVMKVAWSNAQEWCSLRQEVYGLDNLPGDKDSVIVTAKEMP